MKQFLIYILCSLLISFSLPSCDDNNNDNPSPQVEGDGIFEFNVRTRVDGESFVPGVVYKSVQNRDFFVNRLKIYFSDITLIDDQNQEIVLSEIELFDLTQAGVQKIFHGEGSYKQFEVPAKNYKGVRFGIGVAKRFNHMDPAEFAPEHPLSVFNEMHWNWAAGYRFMVFEGKIDSSLTADGAELAKDFVYHIGLDTLYREIEIMDSDLAFSIPKGDELQYVIEFDLNRMFFREGDTLNILENPTTHSVPPGSNDFNTAKKLIDNLVDNSLFKVPL